MLTGKQRAMLKAESHDYKPVVNIGKFSLTDDVISAVEEALEARELIKIKILNNNMDDPNEILQELLEKLGAEFVNHVGNIFTIYRKNEDNKFELWGDKMKIGLYGGTFDPIHIGHLIVLENTLNFMGLDKIIVLPSSNPPHKQNKKKTDTSIRLEMVKAAIEDNPKLELSTFEASDDSVIYTHQTLDYFKNKYPEHEFYYIMGEDSFMTIDSWRNYEKILNDHLIVFARTSIEKDSDLVKKFEQIKKDNEKIYLIDNLNINISSTLIRDLVKENKSIKYLVPDPVYKLIKEYELYV